MKSGVPWNVLGVSPETREVARDAARRSGMPLGEWLDTIIAESARDVSAQSLTHERREKEYFPAAEQGLGTVDQQLDRRLDDIARRLDQLARGQSAIPQPSHHGNGGHDGPTSQRLADAVARIDSRLDQLISKGGLASRDGGLRGNADEPSPAASNQGPPTKNNNTADINQAAVEIAARQRMLDDEPPLVGPPEATRIADPVPHSPTQDVSRLEEQLRQITDRIEALNRPCAYEDVAGPLRAQLSEIAQALNDALPRRALETLENEVRTLAGRIDQSRQSGVDAAALSGIEHGLSEVRDTLRVLTPAESLVGLDGAVNALSEKIDLIAATHQDPEAFQQLEAAITGLHSVVSHVASNDALATLTEEVRSLADKIDNIAAAGSTSDGNAFTALEHRIAALADALESRHPGREIEPPQIDAIVNSLMEKIEHVQLSRSDHVALGHLENRIAELVERLDASDARLGNLEAIERGMVDLLVHLEEMRAGAGADSFRSGTPQLGSGEPQPENDALAKEIAELKEADRRTLDTFEEVHGSIGHVVDRLAKVEENVRVGSSPQAPETGQPVWSAETDFPAPTTAAAPAAAATFAPVDATEPSLAEQPGTQQAIRPQTPPENHPAKPAAAPRPLAGSGPPPPIAPRLPINPDLPPDHPLEPGAGTGRGRNAATPVDAAAASEAAPIDAKPPVIPDPGGKPDFIAAARRAAQAAAAEKPDQGRPQSTPNTQGQEPIGQRLGRRMRSLFVGVAVAVIAIGALHVAKNFILEAEPEIAEQPSDYVQTDAKPDKSDAPADSPASSDLPAAADATQSDAAPAGPPNSATPAPADIRDPGEKPSAAPASEPDRKAAPRPAAATEVTSSIPLPPAPAVAPPSEQQALPAVPAPDSAATALPASIGGTSLRLAAAKGDAAAAYEVAARYAEGRHIRQDLKEAARWFELAAKAGLAPAQFRLGALYEKGQGVGKDLNEARRLYLAAAEKGHAKAMHNLAVLYAERIDGKPAYSTAAKWFRKAAEHGVADSQYNLGVLYARGIGVGQNLAESYKWFALAAREGDKEAAKKRDDVAARLDQQSLMAARLAVQTWTAQPEPAAATEVKAPPGGWDRSAVPAKSRKRTHG